MFFFFKFPKMSYGFVSKPNEKKIVTNILTAFFLRKINTLKSMIFNQYTIRDDDSVESLSHKFYKDPMYYWSILLVNDIIDPYTEWAMPTDVLEVFVAKKYLNGVQQQLTDGTMYTVPHSSGVGGIHHFFNVQTGRVCDDLEDEYYRGLWERNPQKVGNNILPVTNFEYEREVNLERRKIILVIPSQIISFQEDFNKMLRGTQV